MCGIFTSYTLDDLVVEAGNLDHRGREGGGYGAYSPTKGIYIVKWVGGVGTLDKWDLYDIFPSDSLFFFGHLRYATKGRKDKLLQDTHPHVIGGKRYYQGDHVIIENADAAIVHNGQVDEKYLQSVDESLLTTDCDSERLLHEFLNRGEEAVIRDVPGAYSCVIVRKGIDGYVAVRDRHGINPGALGFKGGKYLVASEDHAITAMGGEFVENMRPGAAYYFDANGKFTKKKFVEPDKKHCCFQYTYMADRRSKIDQVGVNDVRLNLAKVCAAELERDGLTDGIDIVTYIPRTPRNAARLLAERIRKPYYPLLYKSRGTRTFMGPDTDERRDVARTNINLNPNFLHLIKGRTILELEDSTVRGNNGARTVELFAPYEPKKIIMMKYTPKVGLITSDGVAHGCESGVDMPPHSEDFIARGRNDEEIAVEMIRLAQENSGMSIDINLQVRYISEDGFFSAFEKTGMPRDRLCYFCLSGPRPF